MTITELEHFISQQGKDVYSFCMHLTGNKEEGEELYQDTFLKAVELAKKIINTQNPKSFILSIAIRLWNNKKRKYGWRQRIVPMDYYDFFEENGYSQIEIADDSCPEKEILRREMCLAIREEIQKLPDKLRIPIYLYYSAGLSYEEIGVCLKLSKGTVKSRLHRGRMIIKKELEDTGYDR